jgi:uncharacterized membrane protein YhaH (DUF805 family)
VGFGEAISVCFSKYATFTGRAARPEYWYWVLFTVLASLVCEFIDKVMLALAFSAVHSLFTLVILLPSIAVGVRRLHDIDKSGWWLLIGFVPILGMIVLIIFAVRPGTEGPNRFGPAPQNAPVA